MRHLIYWIALVVVGTLSGLLLVRYHMIAGKFQNNMEDFHVVIYNTGNMTINEGLGTRLAVDSSNKAANYGQGENYRSNISSRMRLDLQNRSITNVLVTSFRRSPLILSRSNTSLVSLSTPNRTVDIKTLDMNDSPFIREIARVLKDRSAWDLVGYTGHIVKKLMEPKTLVDGISLTGKSKYRRWRDVVVDLNKSRDLNSKQSSVVHLHNEWKLGDFLELINNEYWALTNRRQNRELLQHEFLWAFEGTNMPPIVMTNSVDENWGFLSTPIGTRTTKWINMTNHLRIHHSSYLTMQYFLNSSKLLLLTCNTHVDPQIGYHDKILSLPLGVKNKEALYKAIMSLAAHRVNKTRVLLINNSGWGDRSTINSLISKAFNGSVSNTYRAKPDQQEPLPYISSHYYEVATSKFVLCPSGLGFDSYRLWETLLLGSIPIVESNHGFDRTYSRLPVLVVHNYSAVTPDLLEQVYPCFYRQAHKFSYQHLLQTHWQTMLSGVIKTGQSQCIQDHHPAIRPYCHYDTKSTETERQRNPQPEATPQ